MSIRLASHLYRNRHGTFYFRLVIPAELQQAAQRTELRFSLATEQRHEAIIRSLPFIEDLPRQLAGLRRMAEDCCCRPKTDHLVKIQPVRTRAFTLKLPLVGQVLAPEVPLRGKKTHQRGRLSGRRPQAGPRAPRTVDFDYFLSDVI